MIRADSFHSFNPGTAAPVSFGMANDPSQNMSLNPGAGMARTSIQGQPLSFGGGMPTQGSPQPSWQPDSSLSVTNLAPVNVTATTMGTPMYGGLDRMGNGGIMGGIDLGSGQGVPVKDLAPVKVTAQLPRKPGWGEQLWMRKNDLQSDHPVAYQAAKNLIGSAIPVLPAVMAFANAYQNYKHGQPLFGGMFSKLGDAAQDMFGGSLPGGGPLSSTPQHPLYKDLYTNGISGSGATGSGGPSQTNPQLPNYPGLQGMSAYPIGLSDPGGYWNQVAIHDAALPYGPFAGYANKPLPTAPFGT